MQLDVMSEDDWTQLSEKLCKETEDVFTGVIICKHRRTTLHQTLTSIQGNLLHCSPVRTQDDIFSHLGNGGSGSSTLVKAGGWVAVYGAFLRDDGSFASEGDEKVRLSGKTSS